MRKIYIFYAEFMQIVRYDAQSGFQVSCLFEKTNLKSPAIRTFL